MTLDRIDHDAVRQLALILTETGLTEIEVEGKDGRIRVVRAPAQVVQATLSAAPPVLPAGAAPPTVVPPDDALHPGAVLSPMVGIAYLSPDPSAPMFVNVGQTVVAGQTLLLIEAMKTFNQIKAPKAGTVTAILVQSGAPVEYGEALIVLE
jgi:acetyl-CoA carboxylase biotin carboxyl carrier protein